MKSALAAGVLLLLALTAAGVHPQGSTQDQTAVLLVLEKAWNQAEMTRDAKALDPLLHDRFSYVEDDGSLRNKQQFLAYVQAGDEGYEMLTNEEMHAESFGDTAIVTGIFHERIHQKGKSFVRRGRFTDTWLRQDSRWRCIASQSTLFPQ